ncbi:hypothetical protein DUNSADRAFT_10905 [Dunaliella salina]|uniref:EF-hand domain-containing protein n=1 Tax=Dunaliella salina TaxID=3046 RepID=A0ABQ7H4R7_DUNSA|nr:hypothetical protein DUNSADRAFT_10905 [Dunaliella salina]|eukprot:KAF5841842.1 hypothetical protein DUNSADRAFT_10905 [Dunaliella salina]
MPRGPKASNGTLREESAAAAAAPAGIQLSELRSQHFSTAFNRRVNNMDRDGDGLVDVNELKDHLRDEHRAHQSAKQMKILVVVMFITLLASIGATCGTTYAMVAYLKCL